VSVHFFFLLVLIILHYTLNMIPRSDCGESDCITCYGQEKSPMVIEEIYPPSSQPLVEAVYSQDVDAVTAILSRDPNLANSWVSLQASNYKVEENDCPPGHAGAKAVHTIEPLLLFAATIRHYKNNEKYTHNVPEESIDIVRAIIHHGGRIWADLPAELRGLRGFPAAWYRTHFGYITGVQDVPAILELCMQAGEDLTRTRICAEGTEIFPGHRWEETLNYAAAYDAGRSMGVLLDAMLSQGCGLAMFLPFMYIAARYGSNSVIDAFLDRGGAPLIDSDHPMSLPDQTLLLTAAKCNTLRPRYRFDSEALAKREALCCALIDAGASTQYDFLLRWVCQWAGHALLDRLLLSRHDSKDNIPYRGIVFLKNGTENTVGNGDKHSALHIASICLNIAAAEKVILHNAYIRDDNRNRTPLHWLSLTDDKHYEAATADMITAATRAPLHKTVRIARLLVEMAKVPVNQQDEYGRTALHYACMLKRIELIKALPKFGAQMNIKDKNGRTPLHAFAEQRADRTEWREVHQTEPPYPYDLTAMLKEHVADSVDTADDAGTTALAVACSEFSVARVKLLLAIGANPNIKDAKSWTPLHHAMCRPRRLRRGCCVQRGPTTTWDVACAIMESIKALLLAAGADAGARNETGQTAADVADQEAKAAVMEMTPNW
jgi:ankyrin repeat protein